MRRVYVGRLSHHVRERDVERFFRQEGKIREVMMKDGFAFVEFDHTEDAEAAVRHLNGREINGDRVHVEFAKGPPRGRGGERDRDGRDFGGDRRDRGRRDYGGDRGGDRRDGNGRGSSFGRRNTGQYDRNNRMDSRNNYRTEGRREGGGISYAEKYGPPRNTDFRVIVENLSSRCSWQDLKDLMRSVGEVTFADAHKRERNMGIVDFASMKDMRHAVETLDGTEFHGRRIKVYEDKSRHRSRSRSPSKARSGSPNSRTRSRSRSQSRSRSRSRSRSASKEQSGSPAARNRSRSRSRSRSASKEQSGSPPATRSKSRSRSRSPVKEQSGSPSRDCSRSRSRSQSRSRSGSRTSSKAQSASPARNTEDS